ncbi:ATP synthase F1 subunit epsilon [Candidatus Dojkabacteria bacterium]|nr:ATP synthase F1 subunit epsilon [Candidatus Dojkabacteria bacterium]
MRLKIVTASKTLLDIEHVIQVNIPGIDGILGILPGHINIITPLQIGTLVYKTSETDRKVIAIKGGIAKVKGDYILILADDAELSDDLIKEQIEESIKNAENKISSGNLEYTELIMLEKQLRYERLKMMHLDSNNA